MKLESMLERAHLHQSYFIEYPIMRSSKHDKCEINLMNTHYKETLKLSETNINPYFWYYREDIIDEDTKIVEKTTRKAPLSSIGHSELFKLPDINKHKDKNLTALSNYKQTLTLNETRNKSQSKLILPNIQDNSKEKKSEKKKPPKPRQRLKGTSEIPVQQAIKKETSTSTRVNEEIQALSRLRAGLSSGKLRYLAVSEKFIADARNMIYNPATQSFLPKLKQQYLKSIIVK
jgi:hypothetical protein